MRIKTAQIGNATLFCGDSFRVLPKLDVETDAVISDMPYGITACGWDQAPPLDLFWEMMECRTKQSTDFVLFGCGKFAHKLYNSNPKWYRYDNIWVKSKKVGYLNANLQPMRNHESILVFVRPGYFRASTYNPQKIPGGRAGTITRDHCSGVYRNKGKYTHVSDGTVHPGSVLYFKSETGQHPTQKPVALMEWLVRAYSNAGDIVLDPFMGSGSTGVACMNAGRAFIGIERNKEFFDIACKRIEEAYADPSC